MNYFLKGKKSKNGITLVYITLNSKEMKFLKPILIILTLVALTYTVSASNFNKIGNAITELPTPTTLPVNNDLLFALTAIVSLGGYMVFKK